MISTFFSGVFFTLFFILTALVIWEWFDTKPTWDDLSYKRVTVTLLFDILFLILSIILL